MGYRIQERAVGRCLECGDTITYGRKDKVFCCQGCKNKYNNRKIRRSRETRKKIQDTLARNYAVLDRIIKMDIVSIDLYDLVMMGFKREYSTSYRKYGVRNEYHCYDIKYYMTDSRIFGIKRELMLLPEEANPSTPKSSALGQKK